MQLYGAQSFGFSLKLFFNLFWVEKEYSVTIFMKLKILNSYDRDIVLEFSLSDMVNCRHACD